MKLPSRNRIRDIATALFVGAVVIGAIHYGGTSNSATSSETGTTPTAGLNEAIRDGKFEFVVTNIKCGIAQVGDSESNKKAQGQFCQVSISVKNIGDEPQSFYAGDQHAFNAAGQTYDVDTEAAYYLDDADDPFPSDINPGNAVSGIVIFDIPKTEKITKLELHDSSFSGGASVEITESDVALG
jgi:Domain of unknown function (DUF4352)